MAKRIKYPVAGSPTGLAAMATLNSTFYYNLLGATITGGRELWLRRVWAFSKSLDQHCLIVSDGPTTWTSGATGINVTGWTNQTGNSVYARLMIAVNTCGYTEVEIPEPGVKFTNFCVASVNITASDGISAIGGSGYEI